MSIIPGQAKRRLPAQLSDDQLDRVSKLKQSLIALSEAGYDDDSSDSDDGGDVAQTPTVRSSQHNAATSNEFAGVKEDIETLCEDVCSMKEDIDSLKTEVANMKTDVSRQLNVEFGKIAALMASHFAAHATSVTPKGMDVPVLVTAV
jgi:hypothetical protein